MGGGQPIRLSHRSAWARCIKKNGSVLLRTLAERLIPLLPMTQEKKSAFVWQSHSVLGAILV